MDDAAVLALAAWTAAMLRASMPLLLATLGETLDEAHDDARDVDVGELELLLQHERQQQVEGALEGVEVQLELTHGETG